jgi:hypothetical protein
MKDKGKGKDRAGTERHLWGDLSVDLSVIDTRL